MENQIIAIPSGAVVVRDPGFMQLVSLEPRLEGNKIVFPFQIVVDFNRMILQPGKITIVKDAEEQEKR